MYGMNAIFTELLCPVVIMNQKPYAFVNIYKHQLPVYNTCTVIMYKDQVDKSET